MAGLLRIVEDVVKIKRLLNELRELIEARPIDRDRCMRLLREMYASYLALFLSLNIYLAKRKELRGDLEDIRAVIKDGHDMITGAIAFCMLATKIDVTEEQGIQLEKIDDDKITNAITISFYSVFAAMLKGIEHVLDIPSGLQYLIPLIEKYGVSINWIVAITYLSKMEVVVNDALKRLGVDVEGGFKERVNALLKELEKRGVRFGELEKLLTSTFWDLRNKVVHGGYTPNDEELQIVISTVDNFLRKIRSSLSMGLHSPAHFN